MAHSEYTLDQAAKYLTEKLDDSYDGDAIERLIREGKLTVYVYIRLGVSEFVLLRSRRFYLDPNSYDFFKDGDIVLGNYSVVDMRKVIIQNFNPSGLNSISLGCESCETDILLSKVHVEES